MIKKLDVHSSVGMALAHDVTKIVPEGFKGAVFKRGHIITESDIEELLNIGKEHVFVLEPEVGELHEEDAALRIARAIAGANLKLTDPKEGKVDLVVTTPGLLRINVPVMDEINAIGEMIIATLHENVVYQAGTRVAGMRSIPLLISEAKVIAVEDICMKSGKIIEVIPLPKRKVGVVICGNEVYKGRVVDAFSEVIHRKIEALGSVVAHEVIVPDDVEMIAASIKDFCFKGDELILACGGMSKDPDDVTVEGIRKSGAQIVFYGAPVLPGSLSLYAQLGGTSIMGVPSCVIHSGTTGFDLLLPRVLAGRAPSREEISRLGHGGLCLGCETCRYPVCPYGK